jgi:hypothetical protein
MRFGHRMLERKGCFAAITGSALVIIFVLSQYVMARTSIIGGDEFVPDSSMLFIENSGQYDSRVRFQARSSREMLWITGEGIWITLLGHEQEPGRAKDYISAKTPGNYHDRSSIAANIKLWFKGANHDDLIPFAPASTIVTIGTAGGPVSARAWGGVRYEDLYDGLDLEIFS